MKRYYAFVVTTFAVLLIVCTLIYYLSYLESRKKVNKPEAVGSNNLEDSGNILDENAGQYYLKSEDGIVIVYYPDKRTIFEDTYINIKDLKPSEADKLSEGFYVDDLDKLYSVLEGYTS